MKLITREMVQPLIAAYEHSAKTGENGTKVIAKLFTPWANATWYITEGIPVSDRDGEPLYVKRFLSAYTDPNCYDWHLWGFGDMGDRQSAELGYVMLAELQSLKHFSGLRVERDLHYEGTLTDVLAEYGRIAA